MEDREFNTIVSTNLAEIVGHCVMALAEVDALNDGQRLIIAKRLRTIAEAFEAMGNDPAAAEYASVANLLLQPRS